MLSETSLKQFAIKFQTSFLNISREYIQNLFLSYLYRQKKSEHLAFKGGTALKIVFGSPRFSEDLDFSSNLTPYHLQELLEQTLKKLTQEMPLIKIEESKKTSGGYFARYIFEIYDQKISIELNISLRDKTKPEPTLVTTPLLPAYQCLILPTKKLVWEKIDALFRRQKPRDFFDLYFFLRERRGLEEIIAKKKKLLEVLRDLDANQMKRELKLLLPATYKGLLKDFPKLLISELKRL